MVLIIWRWWGLGAYSGSTISFVCRRPLQLHFLATTFEAHRKCANHTQLLSVVAPPRPVKRRGRSWGGGVSYLSRLPRAALCFKYSDMDGQQTTTRQQNGNEPRLDFLRSPKEVRPSDTTTSSPRRRTSAFYNNLIITTGVL